MKNRFRHTALLLAVTVLFLPAALPAAAEETDTVRPDPPGKEYRQGIRVEGPAEIRVSLDGEALDSNPAVLRLSASFGTLTVSDSARILDLKEGADYSIRITGTEEGSLTYIITRTDPSGEEADTERIRFENIALTENTKIDVIGSARTQVTLRADTDGDGKTDAAYGAAANSPNITVVPQAVLFSGILLLVIIALPLLFPRKKRVTVSRKPILLRKG